MNVLPNQNKLDQKEMEELKQIIEWDLFLDTLVLTLDFCLRNKKFENLDKTKELISHIIQSFTNDEKNHYQNEVNILVNQTVDSFLNKINKKFGEETKKIIADELIKHYNNLTPTST